MSELNIRAKLEEQSDYRTDWLQVRSVLDSEHACMHASVHFNSRKKKKKRLLIFVFTGTKTRVLIWQMSESPKSELSLETVSPAVS